jgi:hypothetical protein
MVGVVLTLVFGSVLFYLYNRLLMTERKMSLVEGVLTDLKIMMDAAPYATGPPPSTAEFEPSPEYLNTISGPIPLQQDEMEEMDGGEYQQTLEQALEQATSVENQEKSLFVSGDSSESSPLVPVNVTKLLPDLESMSVKELGVLAKERGLTVPSGTRKKELIELLKKAATAGATPLEGPPVATGASLDSMEVETIL